MLSPRNSEDDGPRPMSMSPKSRSDSNDDEEEEEEEEEMDGDSITSVTLSTPSIPLVEDVHAPGSRTSTLLLIFSTNAEGSFCTNDQKVSPCVSTLYRDTGTIVPSPALL